MTVDNGSPQEGAAPPAAGSPRHVFGWILLGCLLGALLVVAFIAYGQPALLLDQMNLRYCG